MANLIRASFPLLDMIQIALDNKRKIRKLLKVYTPDRFITEFCIVTFGLPRQCGNSSAIDAVSELLSKGMKLKVKRIYINQDMNRIHKGDGTIIDFILHTPRDVDIVMLDNASYTDRMESFIGTCVDLKLYTRKNFLLVLVQ